MAKDDNYCFHCVEHHGGAETLRSFIEKQSISRKINENLNVTRTILNVLSIVTSPRPTERCVNGVKTAP